jgi:Cd2+/Zn2+-exporting ATPase
VGQSLCRACAVLALGGTGSVLVGVPTAYLAALLNAPKNGVAYRGTQCLEKLSKADTVVFEKRGTLAASELRVMAVKSDKMDADMMLKIAAHAEAYSKDPAAKSIIAAYGGVIYIELIQHYREIPGEGIAVMIQNIPIMLGSQHFLEAQGIGVSTDGGVEKAVFMAVNGQYAGRIVLGSSVKEDAVPALQMLSEVGVRRTVVTTDEGSDSASAFASAVGIRDVKSDFNPRVNAQFVGDLVSKQQGTGAVIFVAGDASQAEAMEKADVGVAMGSVNSCLSCGAADMMIFSSPTSLADEIAQARAARKRAGVSLAVPAAVKAVLAVLCAFGVIGAWIALLVDGVAAGAAATIAARK